MSNSKNKLQEYCQKNKLPLPAYDTVQTNEGKYPPIFESTLVFNKISYHSIGKSKVNVEKEIAQLVCDQLESLELEETTNTLVQKYSDIEHIPIENYNRIYLIDGDNCQIGDEACFNDLNSLYIYFVAMNSTRLICRKHQQKYDNCCIFISPTISKDSVDHFISYHLGKMSVLWGENKEYFIYTRDHFGECLEKFIPRCHLICSM